MKIPTIVPEKGFYYHRKHDPAKGIRDYAYEVVGVGIHTEDDCRPDDANMVIYRPLYEASVFKAGRFYDIRPLNMWMEQVDAGNGTMEPRFKRITDPDVIRQLDTIKRKMYEDN